MIRQGYYCMYRSKVFRCGIIKSNVLLRSDDYDDLIKNGFEDNPFDKKGIKQEKYRKLVPKDEIEWFCQIWSTGEYKGDIVSVDEERDDRYLISSRLLLSKKRGVFDEEHGFKVVEDGGYDTHIYAGYVDKAEVTNVTEHKRAINDDLKAPDNWDF